MTASDLPVDIVRARRHGIADPPAHTAARLPARTAVADGAPRRSCPERQDPQGEPREFYRDMADRPRGDTPGGHI